MRRNILTLILLCLSLGALAQAPGEHLYFTHYDSNSGLSQNTVSDILQDKQGYIWVATHLGVDRFDGIRFRHVDKLPMLEASALYQDEEGMIWVGTVMGLWLYNPVTTSVVRLELGNGPSHQLHNRVNDIVGDGNGSVFVAVDREGLYRVSTRNHSATLLYDQRKDDHGTINRLALTPSGKLWLGTYGNGLFTSNADGTSFRKVTTSNPAFSHTIITRIRPSADGRMMVSTDNCGLYSFNTKDLSSTLVFSSDERGTVPYIRDFLQFGANELWIATEDGLFVRNTLSGQTSHLLHNYVDSYSLSDNALYTLLRDRDGGVWIGSYFGGLNYANPSNTFFEKYHKGNLRFASMGRHVRELCEDADGTIWIGSEDGGLGRFNPATGEYSHLAESRAFTNVHGLCAHDGKLWIGTFSKGLKILDTRSGRLKDIRSTDGSGLASDYVFSICHTREGEFLLGTMSGLQRYDAASQRFETIPALAGIFTYVVAEDSRGNLWAGTYSYGLFCRRKGMTQWKRYSMEDGLASTRVIGIYEDLQGKIWAMTNTGLCEYVAEEDCFSTAFNDEYVPHSIVYQILDDPSGNYWLSTNNGLYKIDPKKGTRCRYTIDDGLTSNYFNYASSLKASNGTMFFGTIDGMIAFNPLAEHKMAALRKPVITDIYLFDKILLPDDDESPLKQIISQTTELRLGSDQNSLAFDISLLEYEASLNTPIKYRMEGLDRDWRYCLLADARLSYPNMRYGKYKLQVVAINHDTGEESQMTELTINIAAPLLLTAWAQCFYVLVVVGLITMVFLFYRKKKNHEQNLAIEHARQEQEREMYNSKITFFTNVAHEIRTPLTLIKAPLDYVLRSDTVKRDKDVLENLDVINLNADRLLLLVNQLLDFRKMESGKFQIHKQETNISQLMRNVANRFMPTISSGGFSFDMALPEEDVLAVVDSEAVTKILSNLFTNALKYGNRFVRAQLIIEGGNFQIMVSNDGKIVDPSEREQIFTLFNRGESQSITGTGIGLSYARSLARMHDGYLVMDEDLTQNTFILTIPIDSAADIGADEQEDLEYLIKRNKDSATILVVEDNQELAMMIVRRLTPHNYKVLSASNGEEALRLLQNEYVDLIISDVMMPEMDGFELLSRLRSDVNSSHIPVILLTAKTDMRDKVQGLQMGADAYIEKPFVFEYLLANISTLLRNRERLRQKLGATTAGEQKDMGLNEIDMRFLEQLNAIIAENYSNSDFSMDDIFYQLGMSRSSFYRKTKGLLNQSPNDYIRIYRLNQAAKLFDQGHTNISEVCYLVGFSSPSYFTKCFQRQFNTSPKDYTTRQK